MGTRHEHVHPAVQLQRRPGSIDDMALLHEAKQKLAELGIAHSTIQLEPPDHG